MVLKTILMERCLLYLLDRSGARGDDFETERLAQRCVAEALGVRQAHVSRAMRKLSAAGLARATKFHMRGGGKKKLAYLLTSKGLREAKVLRQSLEDSMVNIVDLDGERRECILKEVYTLLPQRPKISDLMTSMKDGCIDLRRFTDWQGRMFGGKIYDVREAIAIPHFTGREETLAHLDMFLKEPKVRVFLLVGLPGVGKTALASKWITDLKGYIHIFLRNIRSDTTCHELLSDLAGMLRLIGRPALSDYLHRPSEGGKDLSWDLLKRDIFGIRALIVLDNAHLAREDFARIAAAIIDLQPIADNPKVLLLARERVSFLRAEDRALGRVQEEEMVDLNRTEATAMLAAMGVGADRQDAILDRCGGNPLCLELAADKRIPLEAIRRMTVDRLAQDVLSRLSREVREALAFAAIFEGPVPMDVLGGYGSELLKLCLLREEDGNVGSIHDVVREAVIQSLSPGLRNRLHLRAGHFYARSRDPCDILKGARHFIHGEADEEARKIVAERGQDIIDAGFAESLLSVLGKFAWRSRDDGLEGRIALLRGNALFALGRWIEAAREYEVCSSLGEVGVAAEAMLGQGKAEAQRRSPRALQHLMIAQERLERMGALRPLAEAQYWIGGVHEDAGRLNEARDAFEKGRVVAFNTGDRRWEGLCRYGIGRILSVQGREDEAALEKRVALDLLRREGCRLEIAKVCAALSGTYMALRRVDEAESFAVQAISEARSTGAAGILASSLYNLASLKNQVGVMKEAIPLLEEALGLHERLEKYDEAAWCAAWIASEEWLEGHFERGDQFYSSAERLLSLTLEPALRAKVLRNFARAAVRAGRREDARRHLDRAIAEAHAANLGKIVTGLSEERDAMI